MSLATIFYFISIIIIMIIIIIVCLFVFLFLCFSRKQNTKIIYRKLQHNYDIKK